MVRTEGLEPPRLTPPEPKSGVSTNFTTPAGREAAGVAHEAVGGKGAERKVRPGALPLDPAKDSSLEP